MLRKQSQPHLWKTRSLWGKCAPDLLPSVSVPLNRGRGLGNDLSSTSTQCWLFPIHTWVWTLDSLSLPGHVTRISWRYQVVSVGLCPTDDPERQLLIKHKTPQRQPFNCNHLALAFSTKSQLPLNTELSRTEGTSSSMNYIGDIRTFSACKMTKSEWSTTKMQNTSLFINILRILYNVWWCALHNLMNQYCTTQWTMYICC